jgi:acyl-CoA synthetase (AMP-forming)/AMP-acid ligase II
LIAFTLASATACIIHKVVGSSNIADLLRTVAAKRPDAPGLHVALTGSSMSFGDLEDRAGRLAAGLAAVGLRSRDRVLVMLRPGLEFVATAFALLRMGCVPVFADPGLGIGPLLSCIEVTAPRGLIAVNALHAVRALRPQPFRSVEIAVTNRRWPGAIPFSRLGTLSAEPMSVAAVEPEDIAVIAFTTGSTGEAKGVCFSHRTLQAQVIAFRALTGIAPGDTQIALLPILAILGPGLGCATVLPDMDPSRPARVDPGRLADVIRRFEVTHGFAAPTIWSLLAEHCERARITLPTLRALMVGGAPVPPMLVERARRILGPDGEVHVVYGATEAVPVTSATGTEILAARETPERGTLVGRPLPHVATRLVRVTDAALASLADAGEVPDGEVGEVAVKGDVVMSAYFGRRDADVAARIPDGAGAWHRMGDLGRFDEQGRLWFCGRKSDRIETANGPLYTSWIEPIFERDPRVARAAVVGVGRRPRQKTVLVVEPVPGHYSIWPGRRRHLARDLRAHASFSLDEILFRRTLPLDIRHNAKILRGELASWATKRVRGSHAT